MKMSFKIFSTTLLVFLIMTASAVFSMLKIAEINEQLHLISKVYNPLRNLASEIEIIFLEENIEIERIEKIESELRELELEKNQLNNEKNKENIANTDESNLTEKSDELDKRKELFNVAVKTLESRELEILEARRLKEPAKTLEELSQKFSISRERVRQIENKAIKKIQEEIKNISENKMIGNA